MKILGLDSSGLVASAAVVEDDVLLGEYTTDYKKTHSQTLLPMLDELSKMIELDLHSIDAIAIAAGPGSFTGLRIGAATAKGLGLALSKPIVEVPTLEGLAYNLWGAKALICPIMDARRNQVYAGIYEFASEKKFAAEAADLTHGAESENALSNAEGRQSLHIIKDQCALSVEELIATLNGYGRDVIFLGDGVNVYRDVICAGMQVPFSFAPAHNNRQRAASVAALGALYYAQGKAVSASEHKPIYLRDSQAERERAEQMEAAGADAQALAHEEQLQEEREESLAPKNCMLDGMGGKRT